MTDANPGDSGPQPPPAWYPDPSGSPRERWWDGQVWTDTYRPATNAFPTPLPSQRHGRPPLGASFPTIARLTEISLAASVAAAAFSAYGSLRVRALMVELVADPDTIDIAEIDTVENVVVASTLLIVLTMVITAALFITWLYRAHRSDQVSPSALRHASGWAIGGWFVPFLNLVRPVQVVLDVTKAAAQAKNAVPIAPRVVLTWWIVFVSGNVLARVASSIADADGKEGTALVTSFRDSATVEALGDLLMIAAGILALLIVRRTTRMLLSRPSAEVAQSSPGNLPLG